MRRCFVSLVVVVAALGPGCADAPVQTETTSVEQWTVSDHPVFTIGSLEGNEPSLLSRAYRAKILSDSSVLVVEGGELRVFDEGGVWLRTIGQQGSGPGDLDSPDFILESDTALLVWDRQLRRLTAFSQNGDVLETTQVASSAIPGFPSLVGVLGGQQFVFRGTEGFPEEIPQGSPVKYSVGQMINTIVIESAEGVDTILRGDGSRRYFVRVRRDDDGLGIGSEPLSSTHLAGLGSDFVAIGHGQTPHLLILDAAQHVDSLPFGFMRTPVDDRVREGVGRIHTDNESERAREVAEIMIENMEWPDSLPYLDKLRVDSSDRIWIRHFPLDEPEHRWSIYSRAEGRIATLALPDSISVLDARGSRLVTRRRDELGVPYLDVWELNGPNSGN